MKMERPKTGIMAKVSEVKLSMKQIILWSTTFHDIRIVLDLKH